MRVVFLYLGLHGYLIGVWAGSIQLYHFKSIGSILIILGVLDLHVEDNLQSNLLKENSQQIINQIHACRVLFSPTYKTSFRSNMFRSRLIKSNIALKNKFQ